MRSFKDATGEQWEIEITTWEVGQVKREMGFYLTSVCEKECELLSRLFSEVDTLGQVLWIVCQEQIKARNLDERAFAQRFKGEALIHAAEALNRAIADFFPNPAATKALNTLLDKTLATMEVIEAKVTQQVEEGSKLDVNSLAQSFIDSVTNTPASPELTPATLGMGS